MLHVTRRRAPGRTLACLLRAAKWVRGQLPVAMEHVPGQTPPQHRSRLTRQHDATALAFPQVQVASGGCSSAVGHIMQSKMQRRLL